MKEFLKLLKKDLAQNAGFGILAFLYIIFVRLITYIAAVSNIIEYYKTNSNAYTTPTLAAVEYMGTGNIFHMLVPSVLGCCFALLTCYYLHGRKTVDFYHSLPLKRTTIFSVKYLSGIIVFVIGYGLNYIFMLAASFAMGVLTPETAFAGFTALVNGIFGYAFIYSVGVLAGLLTATIVTHIVMGTILMFILPTVVILLNAWFDMFFSTYVSSIPDSAYCLSPLIYFCERSLTSISESINDTKTILIMAAGTIIFTVIDFFVCKARRSESAGSALAFKWLNAPLRVIFSIISGVIGGFALSYMFNYVNIISFTLGFLVILVISSLIIEIIFRFDFTAALKNKRCLAVSLVLGIIMITATCFGAKEYNTYVPKAEKIDSLAVYIPKLMMDETYKVKSDTPPQYYDEEFLKQYEGAQLYDYISDSDYIFENMKITDGNFAAEFLSACTEEYEDDSLFIRYDEDEEVAAVSDSAETEVIGGDDEPTEIYITSESTENEKQFINIKCTLKSGRSYYRSYYTDLDKFCDIVSGLVENQEFKRGFWGCFYDMNPEEIKSIQIDNSCNYNEKQKLNLGEGDAQKICEALNSDLLNITFEELTTVSPICSIIFNTGTISGDVYLYPVQAVSMYIYPSCEETIAVLKELGIKFYTADETVETISSISITAYNDSENYNAVFTDKPEIKEILDCTYPTSMVRLIYDDNVNAEIEVYSADEPYSGPTYFPVFKNTEEIPEFVIKSLEEETLP